MPDGLDLIDIPEFLHAVPTGCIAMVAQPLAFIASEAVYGDLPPSEFTYRLPTGHEIRFFGWACECEGLACGPRRHVWEGTRILLLPPGTDLRALTAADLP